MIERQPVSTGLLACFLLFVTPAAYAHSPIEGIDSVYNGMLHPILVPAHILLISAFGLFLGQHGFSHSQPALLAFIVGSVCGLVTAWFDSGFLLNLPLLIAAVVSALLVAINPGFNRALLALCAVLIGLGLGLDSAQETLTGRDKLASLFGSGIAMYFILLYPMALANHFNNKNWQRIGIRIIGSWIAAIATLLAAFALKT
jgi:hydrogenase/urease accessory protein HupE